MMNLENESDHHLALTDANIEKIRVLRDSLAKYNPERSGAFAVVTFPVAATKAAQYVAAKYGIPVTSAGIVLVVETEQDLDLAIARFRDFAREIEDLGNVLPDTGEEG